MDDPTVSIAGGSEPRVPHEGTSWGPFQLLAKIGQGGFGEVYRAWDPKLDREVALKLLLPQGTDDQVEYDRIVAEARTLARVHHPNVVPVYGVDRHDGRVGFWSEFVRGKTLSDLLSQQGPFGPRETGLIGIELCRSLAAVHASGLLHRDIKASNVMREEGGRILLMDFGLSHDVQRANVFGGTPGYMAPELFTGAPPGVCTDIYALGMLLYHLVTGKYPHREGSFRSLMDERPDLPEPFVRVVECAISPDPSHRYASAGLMLAALSQFLGSGAPAVAERRPRKAWIFAIIAALLCAIGAAVWFAAPVRERFTAQSKGVSTSAYQSYLNAEKLLVRYDNPDNVQNAIGIYNKIIERDPQFALAHAGLGRAYFLRARNTRDLSLLDPALKACNRALELDNQLAPVYVTSGLAHNLAGNSDLAMQDVQQALHLDARSADAYAAQGDIYRKQGRESEAEQATQKAIDLAPDDWRWHNQLGVYHLQTGMYEQAVKQFREVVRLIPDNSFGYLNLAVALQGAQHFPEAETALIRAIEIRKTFSAYLNLSTVFSLEGKNAEAVAAARKAIQLNPSYYLAWGSLGAAWSFHPNGHAEALKAYKQAILLGEKARAANPKDAQVVANLGSYYAFEKDADRSIPLLHQALALSPKDPGILFLAGEAFEMLGRRDEALRWVSEALKLGYSPDVVKRSPELSQLRADPRFSFHPAN